MSTEEIMQQLVNRWKQAFGQHEPLKSLSQGAVERWEWTSGERYSLLPYYFQRYPGRARALKAPPASAGYYGLYGFDAQERPRVYYFYNYQDLSGQERLQQDRQREFKTDLRNEIFYSYQGSLVEIIEYSIPPRIPLKVQQIFFEHGRVVGHARFGLNGYTPLYSQKGRDPQVLFDWLGYNGRFIQEERYIYLDDVLVRIQLYIEAPGRRPFQVVDRFNYDDSGKLLRIDRSDPQGNSQLLYRRREKGQTFQSIRQTAVKKLVEAVVKRLRGANIQERLCCLELGYQAGYSHFPPVLFPGLEKDRQRLLASNDPQAQYFVFAPALMGAAQHLEITDPETLEICGQLEQEIKAGEKWEAATKILREVAVLLNRYDWHGILDVAPDFVVFAMDWEMEGDQLAQILADSASPEQMEEWRRKGWI